MIEYLAYGCITAGIIINGLAAVSLIRLPDVHTRLISSTKLVTAGTIALFLGVVLRYGTTATGCKAALCVLFILVTSPVEAHALLRAARTGTSDGNGALNGHHDQETR